MKNISPSIGLKPKAKFFEEIGEELINVDGVIRIMDKVDTPQAKAIRHMYRLKLALMRSEGEETEKMRENALFAAFDELGIRTKMMPLKGTMD